jgi:hypothetical protein
MYRRNTRLRVPALLLAALTALLVFAATASAEVRTGESNTPIDAGLLPTLPEATLVKASASYDTSAGTVSFTVVTEEGPVAKPGGVASETEMISLLISDPAGCTNPNLLFREAAPPEFGVFSKYSEPSTALGFFFESVSVPPVELPAVKTVSGTSTTFSSTSPELLNRELLNCALVEVEEPEAGTGSFMLFPIKAPPAPPAPPVVPSSPPAPQAPQAAPAPAPAFLTVAKPKALKLKVGKSRTVKVKVTNTGATATAQGTLRVKAVRGVLVKPEAQKLPVLAPGASWSVPVRVELTEKAKEKSTLSLIGTASGLTAKSSLVVAIKE